MSADEVRQFLHERRHAYRASAKDPGPMPPVYVSRAQWDEICLNWGPGDGPPPGTLRNGTYWWQDVPVVVVLPA